LDSGSTNYGTSTAAVGICHDRKQATNSTATNVQYWYHPVFVKFQQTADELDVAESQNKSQVGVSD